MPLVASCQAIEADDSQPEFAAIAKRMSDHYEFPVMMMVLSPQDGMIIHSINANNFLDSRSEEEQDQNTVIEAEYVGSCL